MSIIAVHTLCINFIVVLPVIEGISDVPVYN